MELKKTIRKVLDDYVGSQLNIDSEVARDMITDQLTDEIQHKFIVRTPHKYYEDIKQGQDNFNYEH